MQDCIARPVILDYNETKYYPARYSLYAFQNVSRSNWFRQQSFSINGNLQPVFAEISTFRGLAYSFNLMDFEDLLNVDA